MDSIRRERLRALKTSCLCRGLRVTDAAVRAITRDGAEPLTIHEYATTGGVTLELEGGTYVNAPFDEWWCTDAEATLDIAEDGRGVEVRYRGEAFPARALPLPGYLDRRDAEGRPVSEVVMSHADRVRVSPLQGCAFSCAFCDIAGKPYRKSDPERLVKALAVAREDTALPMRHVLVSGGTPSPRDRLLLEEACLAVAAGAGAPVDVMMTPYETPDVIDRLHDGGVYGWALNLEIFDPSVARALAPQKARLGHGAFAASIAHAVERTGGKGRVRSLLVAGLEPVESTLQGVEFLARLGCDPVLSPFRPARGTSLHLQAPPSEDEMQCLHEKALQVARDYGVALGPRCIPCQHNTLTFPDDSGGYYYS